MHAFFIISYNRKYHNIEWLKLSFSRFAHHLSKSRVLIRPPPPLKLSGPETSRLGMMVSFVSKYANLWVFLCRQCLFHNLCQRMRTGLELKKTVVQSSFSSNYHSWNINYCPCNIRFNCNSNTNMTNVSNWSISNALSFSYKKTSKVYKIIQLIFFSVVFSLNLCVWILPYLHSI